jgi:hypothetical protein
VSGGRGYGVAEVCELATANGCMSADVWAAWGDVGGQTTARRDGVGALLGWGCLARLI